VTSPTPAVDRRADVLLDGHDDAEEYQQSRAVLMTPTI